MSAGFELVVTSGPLVGNRYKIGAGGLRLGRSSSNDLAIPDEALSRNHCLFEIVGEGVVRLTDLASANGTFLNDFQVEGSPAFLKVGDRVAVGHSEVRLVREGEPVPSDAEAKPVVEAPPNSVDLGFASKASAKAKDRRRSPFAAVLWAVAGLAVVAALALVLVNPEKGRPEPSPSPVSAVDAAPALRELCYEKVEASAKGIFRYELTLFKDGTLRVSLDDVPAENRHVTKAHQLDARALRTVSDLFAYGKVKALGDDAIGPETDGSSYASEVLKVVYSDRALTYRVVNAPEPEAFHELRAQLETFSKNELGVWAIQYSRDRLVQLAKDSFALACAKFDDRDVNYGNLFASIAAYREVIFYLETVNPKPPLDAEARTGLEEAVKELDGRVKDQRFRADRAINLGQWDVARRELTVLVEMIPDRADPRNSEAMAKLLDVEKRVQKKGVR